LYQGEARITRADGGHVPADVTIWQDNGPVDSSWGGRAVVRLPHSLVNDVGSTCTICWRSSGDAYLVGTLVLSAVHVGAGAQTYRLAGNGELSEVSAAE
jgi:hypothetical protein